MKVPMRLDRSFDFAGQRIAYDIIGKLVRLWSWCMARRSRRMPGTASCQNSRAIISFISMISSATASPRCVTARTFRSAFRTTCSSALLRHWGLQRPFVICHDFGAATVLRAHLLDGCDFARMLIFDAVALRPWGSPFVQHVREYEAAFAGTPAYIHRAILAAYIRGAVRRALSDAELEPYLAPWIGESGQGAFYRQIAQMDQRYTDAIEPPLRPSEMSCLVDVGQR